VYREAKLVLLVAFTVLQVRDADRTAQSRRYSIFRNGSCEVRETHTGGERQPRKSFVLVLQKSGFQMTR
jgi:hypothetical protein